MLLWLRVVQWGEGVVYLRKPQAIPMIVIWMNTFRAILIGFKATFSGLV